MKVCFAASMGGHLEEIEQLKALCGIYDSFLITEKNDFQHVAMGRRTYFLPHLNRKRKAFFRLFSVCLSPHGKFSGKNGRITSSRRER